MSGREIRRRSRLRELLAPVPLAVVLLALMPASASAQTAGNACDGELTGAGQQAELSFSCNFNVNGLEIVSNKDATISGDIKGEEGQGREGFVCVQPVLKGPSGRQGGDSFGEVPAICEGSLSAGNTATGTLVARDDVCDPLALRIGAFSAGAAGDEFIVRIQGCEGGDDGPRPDEDEGQIPRGGVQSGGGAGAPADATSAGLLAAGLILAAALGFGIARVRREISR